MHYPRIRIEIKEQILNRIKNDGIPAMQAAKEAGIHPKTVYYWLKSKGEGIDSNILENNRLKRENRDLLELVGKLTLNLEKSKKN